MVVGKAFTWDELVDIAKHHKLTSKYHKPEEGYEDWDSWDIVNALEEKFPELEFNHGIEEYYEEYCVGMGYGSMKEDETRKDFEARVAKQLSELTGKEVDKVNCLVDGGRDDG